MGGVSESGHRCRGLREVCYCALICFVGRGGSGDFNIYIDRQSRLKREGGVLTRSGREWGLRRRKREKGRVSNEPGLGNDYVVEGGVAFTEAGEADFENHCFGVRGKKSRK